MACGSPAIDDGLASKGLADHPAIERPRLSPAFRDRTECWSAALRKVRINMLPAYCGAATLANELKIVVNAPRLELGTRCSRVASLVISARLIWFVDVSILFFI
jgi:hypothetical protein